MVLHGDMHMNTKQRRKKLAKLMFQGFSLERAVNQLTKEYDVKPETIKDEWYRRKNWMDKVFDIESEDAEALVMETVAENKTLKGAGWSLYEESNNPNTKLGSLKMISSLNKDIIDILVEAGIIELNSNSDALKETLEKMSQAIDED